MYVGFHDKPTEHTVLTTSKGWIGEKNDHFVGHGEALGYLVNAATTQNWKGGFETALLETLCPLVVRYECLQWRK
jgi:hypothetical protein